jgi:hypothetical protein
MPKRSPIRSKHRALPTSQAARKNGFSAKTGWAIQRDGKIWRTDSRVEMLGAWLDAILAGASEYDAEDIAKVIEQRMRPSASFSLSCLRMAAGRPFDWLVGADNGARPRMSNRGRARYLKQSILQKESLVPWEEQRINEPRRSGVASFGT